ncbi:hypothetical protein GF318_03600 [Candidatus Micrarchaeota archaeon]|nr:hypothetical protein [Candidatus Micrarchaeota archaeon]
MPNHYVRFLYNAPAILYRKALIVGDTHFGIEQKLRSKGVYDEQFSRRLFEKLKGLITAHNAEKTIFLGDVKENITVLDEKTKQMLRELSEICDIMIVKGNHDGSIEEFLPAEVSAPEGEVYGELGLCHGHSWPGKELMECRYLVMGHQHPMVKIKDTLGKSHVEPAWIVSSANKEKVAGHYEKFNPEIELVLMPAFNPLVGSVIGPEGKKHLGPVLNNKLFKLNDALVFRLNGTCLGRLGGTG